MHHQLVTAAALGLLLAAPALAETSAVQAFVSAVNSGDTRGCMASFAPQATFIDLGNDFSAKDRLEWFCNEVVKQKAAYRILSETREGDVITWTFDFQAGGYFLEGKGRATVSGSTFTDLVIERR
jgi:hypothetical protein